MKPIRKGKQIFHKEKNNSQVEQDNNSRKSSVYAENPDRVSNWTLDKQKHHSLWNERDYYFKEEDVRLFLKNEIEKIDDRIKELEEFNGLIECELQKAELRVVRDNLINDAGQKLISEGKE